jgi:hypothetical protein
LTRRARLQLPRNYFFELCTGYRLPDHCWALTFDLSGPP